jgi:hypothetical protein
VVFAAALRWHGLDFFPLEQDELYTLRDARHLHASLRPLYFVLQRVLLSVHEPTPLFLRLPAWLFGIGGVWVTWLLARSQFGSTAGLVAAVMVAISPWHLYASQFARYWSLLYLLAATTYLLLLRARASQRRRTYALTCLVMLLGSFTHPTFMFPLVGVIAALHTVWGRGGVRLHWPSRRAWAFLWAPYIAVVFGSYLLLQVAAPDAGLIAPSGRGLAATLRIVPAMIQSLSPGVAVAVVVVATYLAFGGTENAERTWGTMTLFGCSTTVLGLLLVGFRTEVYADYAMSMLPLVFVTVGAAAAYLHRSLGSSGAWVAGAATAVVAAGVSPGTVSHLIDGSRFDYRPAYRHIAAVDPDLLVLTWPVALQAYYRPGLRVRELTLDADALDRILATEKDFWAVVSVKRYGITGDLQGVDTGWLPEHCRLVNSHMRPRFDYRIYRVDLYRCGM